MLVLWSQEEEANIYINLSRCKVQGSSLLATQPPSGFPHQSCVVCGWAFVSLADIDPGQVHLSHGLPSHVGNHGEQATDTQRLQRLESMRGGVLPASTKCIIEKTSNAKKVQRKAAGRPAWNKAMTTMGVAVACSNSSLASSHLTCVTNNKKAIYLWDKSCHSIHRCVVHANFD